MRFHPSDRKAMALAAVILLHLGVFALLLRPILIEIAPPADSLIIVDVPLPPAPEAEKPGTPEPEAAAAPPAPRARPKPVAAPPPPVPPEPRPSPVAPAPSTGTETPLTLPKVIPAIGVIAPDVALNSDEVALGGTKLLATVIEAVVTPDWIKPFRFT